MKAALPALVTRKKVTVSEITRCYPPYLTETKSFAALRPRESAYSKSVSLFPNALPCGLRPFPPGCPCPVDIITFQNKARLPFVTSCHAMPSPYIYPSGAIPYSWRSNKCCTVAFSTVATPRDRNKWVLTHSHRSAAPAAAPAGPCSCTGPGPEAAAGCPRGRRW